MNCQLPKPSGKAGQRSEGSALITVLWVLGLLAMLVASFAFEAHIESRLTFFYRNRTKAEYLAQSGVDVAQLLIARRGQLLGTKRDPEKAAEDIWYDAAWNLADKSTVANMVHDLSTAGTGQGKIRLSITPELAWRDINQLFPQSKENDEVWESILEVGKIPEEMWPVLIDSFYDWTDPDDAPRPDGAETDDYYANLSTPYRAKNAKLDTVGELGLIKGFSKEILIGGILRTGSFERDKVEVLGISDMLTTDGNDGKVNINAADERALRTLPDVDEEMAQLIIRQREKWVDDAGEERNGFRSAAEFFSLFPDFPLRAKDFVTTDSTIFRITSTGEFNGILSTISCIVSVVNDRFVISRWMEDD